MSYSPFPVESFGPLDLNSDPGTVGWSSAIDLLNVDFDQRGRIRSRDGFTTLGTVTNTITNLFVWPGTSTQILVGEGTRVTALDNTGATVASDATLTINVAPTFVAHGTPTSSTVYAANGTDAPRKWNGAAWSTPTATVDAVAGRAMPKGNVLAVQPKDNRLVSTGFVNTIDGPNGAASSNSHVYFSSAGTPETWLTNDFVQLSPGDNEFIVAACAWHDMLFVFKQTKFFVFFGNSTDSTGNPIFNFRTVDAGTGVANARAVVSTPDGVYFGGRGGIYRTTGGPPVLVSGDIDQVFTGNVTNPSYTYAVTNIPLTPVYGLAWHDHKLFVSFPTLSNVAPVMVLDTRLGGWTIYDFTNGTGAGSVHGAIPMASAVLSASTQPELIFAARSGNTVYRHGPASTTDNGTAITSRYRTGFSDLGTPDKKRIREWLLQGSGSPTFQTSVDFGSLETGSAVTLGTAPVVSENRRRYAVRGRQVSFQIGGTSAWSVNNVIAHVADKKLPGET